jgi:NADH-dependent peroxiredoxin subunit C
MALAVPREDPRRHPMTETTAPIQVGQSVPDFTLTTFDPTTGKFGKFDLAEQKKAKHFTVLFFYPADFTFV